MLNVLSYVSVFSLYIDNIMYIFFIIHLYIYVRYTARLVHLTQNAFRQLVSLLLT